MEFYLHPALAVLWILAVASASTELNIYISKQHLAEYYNFNIGVHYYEILSWPLNCWILLAPVDSKVSIVHKRLEHVNSNDRLVFANGTELPPFPVSVDKVTITWLATTKEKVSFKTTFVVCGARIKVYATHFLCHMQGKLGNALLQKN